MPGIKSCIYFIVVFLPFVCRAQIDKTNEKLKGKIELVKSTTYFLSESKAALNQNPVYIERVRSWNWNQQLLTAKEVHHHIVGLNDSAWTGQEICIYNKDNQLLERTFSDAFILSSHSVRKYDDNGRLVAKNGQAKFWFGDSTWAHDEYIYNEAGKKIEVRGISNDNNYPRSIEYYSGSDRLDSAIGFKKDNSVAGRTLIKYDASDREIERWGLGENGHDHHWIYQYNEKGQKVEEHKSGYDKIFEERTLFKYNDKGDVTLTMQYDENGNLHRSITNTYNEKGYLIKVVNADHSERNKVEVYAEDEYADFDNAGNPLKRTERWLKDGKFQTFVTVYEIRYYN